MPGDGCVVPWYETRLRRQVDELFVGVSRQARDDYRAAITALITRDRYNASPTARSCELDDAERMGFTAVLNGIAHGACLIRRVQRGVVEIERMGTVYRVTLDPLWVEDVS